MVAKLQKLKISPAHFRPMGVNSDSVIVRSSIALLEGLNLPAAIVHTIGGAFQMTKRKHTKLKRSQ